MEIAITLHKLVVCLIQGIKLWIKCCIVRTAQLLLQYIVNGFLYVLIVVKALLLGISLYLVGIEIQGNSLAILRHAQSTILINEHSALLNHRKLVRCRLLLRLLLWCCIFLSLAHALGKVCKHLRLVHVLYRIETIAARTEGISLLIAKCHFSSHHLRMLLEIVVDSH